MSVIEEKPPLDELVHYGVKGMKWGVRRTPSQLASSAKKKANYKSTRSSVRGKTEREKSRAIRSARRRQKERGKQVKAAEMELASAQTKKGQKAALKQLNQYKKERMTSPDRHMAQRTTFGEKAAIVLLTPASGGVIAGAFAVNALTNEATSKYAAKKYLD